MALWWVAGTMNLSMEGKLVYRVEGEGFLLELERSL